MEKTTGFDTVLRFFYHHNSFTYLFRYTYRSINQRFFLLHSIFYYAREERSFLIEGIKIGRIKLEKKNSNKSSVRVKNGDLYWNARQSIFVSRKLRFHKTERLMKSWWRSHRCTWEVISNLLSNSFVTEHPVHIYVLLLVIHESSNL